MSATATPTPIDACPSDPSSTVNNFSIRGGNGVFDGVNTTFTWTICGEGGAGFHGLGHFTVDLTGLNSCGGATIEAGTTTPFATSDPPCAGLPGGGNNVVKWDTAVNTGECASRTLVLAGFVETGIASAGTKASTECPVTLIRGPACAACVDTLLVLQAVEWSRVFRIDWTRLGGAMSGS